MAAEHRALWLERLAQEVATMKPGSEWEKILKQMITASRQKATNKRLNSIFCPEWASLDYIEVPNEAWFMSSNGKELYEFDNGIFVAHQQIDERVLNLLECAKFSLRTLSLLMSQLKKMPYMLNNHQSTIHQNQHGGRLMIRRKCKNG
jgi:hypothetical protein